MCSRFVVWGCVEERLWIWIMLGHVLQSTLHWSTLFGGLATFPASSAGISYSDHSRVLFIYHYSKLWVLWQTQKSEIKVERWKCYLAHSHVWNNNTRMIFLRLSRQPSLAGVVTFPGITTTRWRADVNRKEYQRRAIRKSSARQEWYSVRCAVVRISLVRSVPLFQVFPMFTLSLAPAHNVITSNLS